MRGTEPLMPKLRGPLLIGILALGALLFWKVRTSRGVSDSTFRTVPVERGEVVAAVTSTGTLRAITTVQVGTQVSGQIAETLADFNDHVEKGQLIARIDPTLLQQEVRSAEATLERNQAELEQARAEANRAKALFEDGLSSESAEELAKSKLEVAEAVAKNAAINLERARRNLSYSEIRAPIDGVVLERNVDVGQTVAASLSAPQLYLIAEDLSQLQILAAVDEGDIGQVHMGQEVSFTVQSFPNETFLGKVDQVRLQSAITENVVTYTVVVSVDNVSGRLLPGMTATVQFVLERARDVLKVSNVALRFRPTDEMRAMLGGREGRPGKGDRASSAGGAPNEGGGARRDSGETRGERKRQAPAEADSAAVGDGGTRADAPRDSASVAPREPGKGEDSKGSVLWVLEGKGKPRPVRVQTGITDGQFTEVIGGALKEGDEVVAAVTSSNSANGTNPFQSQSQSRRPGPPGM